MPRKITRDDLVRKLDKELDKENHKLHFYFLQERIMEKKLSEEIRRERTHRLCNRGADLEVYLKPEIFSDSLVRIVLKEIFELQAVKDIVEKHTPPEKKEIDEKLLSPETE